MSDERKPCALCGEVEAIANCATECPERQGGGADVDLIEYLRGKAKRASRSPSGKVPMPRKAIDAILSSLTDEPTQEMIEAGKVALDTGWHDKTKEWEQVIAAVYNAMRAAIKPNTGVGG